MYVPARILKRYISIVLCLQGDSRKTVSLLVDEWDLKRAVLERGAFGYDVLRHVVFLAFST